MKKFSLMVFLSAVCVFTGYAQTGEKKDTSVPPKPLSQWTFFQIGFFPGVPGSTDSSNVYGMKLGAPMVAGYGRVYGIEPSIFYSGTNHVYGIQAAWFGPAIGLDVEGLQASCVMTICKKMTGVLGSPVNLTGEAMGFQAGAVNVIETQTGLEIGGVNVNEDSGGFLFGGVNICKSVRGLQMGVFNYSQEGAFQIGLVNMIEEGGLLPFSILFNMPN